MFYPWTPDSQNVVDFVMVNASDVEVPGLGSSFTFALCKSDESTFTEGLGTKSELGSGWYRYVTTAGDADTPGPVAIRVTGAGAAQQNLLAVVKTLQLGSIYFPYRLTHDETGNPIYGARVDISTDKLRNNTIWSGITDIQGYAKYDGYDPLLAPGGYYFWRSHDVYRFSDPDYEVVS